MADISTSRTSLSKRQCISEKNIQHIAYFKVLLNIDGEFHNLGK